MPTKDNHVSLPLGNPKFVTAYGQKVKQPLHFTGDGRTKQAHKDECDINNILAKYKKTGVLTFAQQHEPQYADTTGADFQHAAFVVTRARSMFNAMPAHLRARFKNDPGEFLAFVSDERNRAEAEQLGLVKVKPKAEDTAPEGPNPTPEANPAAAPATPPAS